MDFVKLIVSLFANLSGGIIKKRINDKYENNMFSYQFYNCLVSFSAFVTLIIISDNLSVSLFTILLALSFGIITLLQQITNLMALNKGPFSYTTVIISLSTLIPTVSGKIFWNENIEFIQYSGIILLVVCFVLSVDFGNNDKKAGIRWLIYSFAAFVCTGLIGVMQKVHQSSQYKNELDGFLVIAFAFSFLCSGIYSLVLLKQRSSVQKIKKPVIALVPIALMLLSGIFVALNNKLNLYLSGVLDSAVFFPVVNGGGLILTSVSAVLLFKEKLSVKQWIGLSIGIISVLMICNPF